MTQTDPNANPSPVPPVMPTPTLPPQVPASGEQNMAMFCHLAALAGYLMPAGNVIGPLIIWLIKKDQMPMVNREGKEAINFQITMTIAALVSSALIWAFCIGVVLLVAIGITNLILVIVAAVSVSKTGAYRYPFALRLIK